MFGESKSGSDVDELPPLPVPPPNGPHCLPPTPPPVRDALDLPDLPMPGFHSPALSALSPALLTPHTYLSYTPPIVHTPSSGLE